MATTFELLERRIRSLEKALRWNRIALLLLLFPGLASMFRQDGIGDTIRAREIIVETDSGQARIGEEHGSVCLNLIGSSGNRIVDLYGSTSSGGSLYFRSPGGASPGQTGNMMSLSSAPGRCNLTLYKDTGPAISLATLTMPDGHSEQGRSQISALDVFGNQGQVVASLSGTARENGFLTLLSLNGNTLALGPDGVRAASDSVEESIDAFRREMLRSLQSPPPAPR